MKRFIAIFVLLLSISISAFGQKNTISGSMIINTTDVIKTKKVFAKAKVVRGFEQEASFAWSVLFDELIHHININYIGGFRFNHYLFVGVGSGLDFGAGYSFKPYVMEDRRYVSSSCTEDVFDNGEVKAYAVFDRMDMKKARKHLLPYVLHVEEPTATGNWLYFTETYDFTYGIGWAEFNFRTSDFAYEDNVNINPPAMDFDIVITYPQEF